jgi:hypothetical protein
VLFAAFLYADRRAFSAMFNKETNMEKEQKKKSFVKLMKLTETFTNLR